MSTQANLQQLRQGTQDDQAKLATMRPKDQVAYYLDKKKAEIAKMLPKHLNPERLLKVAQIAATTTPALAKCDIPSLVSAIGQCAQMGLEPNTVLGHAYLVPFNTKRKDANGVEHWVNSVQVIIGYKGLIDLARRSGQIISIASHEVCENDKFELVYGLDEKLNHTPAMGDRGEIIGFYAVAKLKDGGHSFEFMSRTQVEGIRESSQSAYKDEWKNNKKTGNRVKASGPWWDHFTEMGRKTVIRRLAKYLPLSIDFQTAVALDGMAEAGKDQGFDAGVIDGDFNILPDDAPEAGEYQDEPAPAPAQTRGAAQAQESAAAEPAPARQTSTVDTSASDSTEFDKIKRALLAAKDLDTLGVAAEATRSIPDEGQRNMLGSIYRGRRGELEDGDTPAPSQAAAPAPAAEHPPARKRTRTELE